MSDSLTMKYAASSICSGSSCAVTSSVVGYLAAGRQRFERAAQAPLGERHRVKPAREAAQLGLSLTELVAGEPQDIDGLIVAVELALGDLEQVCDGHEPLLGTVVQVAPDAPAFGIGSVDHACPRAPQRGGLMATLELGRRPRREDAHRGDRIVSGPHRSRVHDGHVAEVRAVGGTQADREVALEAHLDRRLGLREAPRQLLRERDDRVFHDECARLALRVVLQRLVHPVAVVPAADHTDVLAIGLVASATNANFASNASET